MRIYINLCQNKLSTNGKKKHVKLEMIETYLREREYNFKGLIKINL